MLNLAASNSDVVFRHMLDSLKPAQQLILSQSGTLTTLVITVIARLEAPVARDGLQQNGMMGESNSSATAGSSSSSGNESHRMQWAAMTITIGDSAAFVYRRLHGRVEEITYAAHVGAYRDMRFTPGALGFAQGKEPDLGNLACTMTLLDEGERGSQVVSCCDLIVHPSHYCLYEKEINLQLLSILPRGYRIPDK